MTTGERVTGFDSIPAISTVLSSITTLQFSLLVTPNFEIDDPLPRNRHFIKKKINCYYYVRCVDANQVEYLVLELQDNKKEDEQQKARPEVQTTAAKVHVPLPTFESIISNNNNTKYRQHITDYRHFVIIYTRLSGMECKRWWLTAPLNLRDMYHLI
jgi:hypothetical protein